MADGFVIGNVRVIDGTAAASVVADVEVTGDRITAVRQAGSIADPTIDGSGLALTPGFIDVHTHDDTAVLTNPDHGCKTLQGVTSVVVGNCGTSIAPLADHDPMASFDRVADYFDALDESPAAVNVAALVGHGTIRASVMGLRTDRRADDTELAAMRDLLESALADGAVGMSSGLAYEPGRYADADELAHLNELVADAGAIYTTHMRNEGEQLLESVDEAIGVAETTGVRLQISHLKAAGRRNWGAVVPALERIDAARARGVDVMADQYPYTRGSTLLEQVLRQGAMDGDSAFGSLTGAQLLIAAAPRNRVWEGRTLAELAAEAGVSDREMADRVVDAEGRACIVVLDTMDEADVRTVMAHPVVMTGSDGIPLGDRPHPRLHHTYPRVLGHYSRELGIFGIEEAVHRMTGMPAERFGLTDRGVIREGAYADLVLFDPDTIGDSGTYMDPTTVPDGIHGVWANGTAVAADGEITGARPGRALRRA